MTLLVFAVPIGSDAAVLPGRLLWAAGRLNVAAAVEQEVLLQGAGHQQYYIDMCNVEFLLHIYVYIHNALYILHIYLYMYIYVCTHTNTRSHHVGLHLVLVR